MNKVKLLEALHAAVEDIVAKLEDHADDFELELTAFGGDAWKASTRELVLYDNGEYFVESSLDNVVVKSP